MAESQDSAEQMPRVLSGACDARQSTAGSLRSTRCGRLFHVDRPIDFPGGRVPGDRFLGVAFALNRDPALEAPLSGHALFLGPTVYANLSPRSWIAIGWSIQVAGRSVEDPGWLDLTNFERQQARLLFGFTF